MQTAQQQVPKKIVELKKLLMERGETVKLCIEYLKEVCALDYPLSNQHISLENLSKREGVREACLVLSLALTPPKSNIIMPKKKIKI